MKPRIYKSRGMWHCYTRGHFGLRVLGQGYTPAEAYESWRGNFAPEDFGACGNVGMGERNG